ncbi:MAG: hypothetical protein NTY09_08000 [bacterium]|nr:hypothetical protein [bacterium]
MKVVKYLAFTALFILVVGIIACNPATQTGQPSGNDRETAQSPNSESGQPAGGTGEGQGIQSPVEGNGTDTARADQQIDGVASPSGTGGTGTGDDQIVTIVLPDGNTVTINYRYDLERMADLDLPEGWPNDVPIMNGFELHEERFYLSGMPFLKASGNATPEMVKSYYSHLPGWELFQDMPSEGAPGSSIFFMMKKDIIFLNIDTGPVSPDEDQSKGNTNLSLWVGNEPH